MADMYGPPQEYNGRGDPMFPAWGYTPQGDPIMDRYDSLGNRISNDILGYTGRGDPIYFETTARGDLIPRQLDPRFFQMHPPFLEYGDDDFWDDDDFDEFTDDEEVKDEPNYISQWPIYQEIISAEYRVRFNDDDELSAIDKEEFYFICRRALEPFDKAIKALDALEQDNADSIDETREIYSGARFLRAAWTFDGRKLFLPLGYENWKEKHTNFGPDPNFAYYVVAERYDEYVQHIAKMNGLEVSE